MTSLPFSEAAERNRQPILETLRGLLGAGHWRVVEVGAGTGQHAEHIARHWPEITWQTTDRADYLAGLEARIRHCALDNLPPPRELDVDAPAMLAPACDVVYSANTLHIMTWPSVERFFALTGQWLAPGGRMIVYGPFHVGGQATSKSNAHFDASLRSHGTGMGVRGREAVCRLADRCTLSLTDVVTMPANNQMLCFGRRSEAELTGRG